MASANECDGASWQIIKISSGENFRAELVTTIYKFDKQKVKPSEDHGFYKYDVLMVKEDNSEAQCISAYIGDVDFFINNQASLGFVGMLIKKGILPKTKIKKLFNQVLVNLDFNKTKIKFILKRGDV